MTFGTQSGLEGPIKPEKKSSHYIQKSVSGGNFTPFDRITVLKTMLISETPQWGAADTEIKVPSGENTELTCSPFKDWSRSVYSHTCYAYCQGFLPCLFLPFRSIHLYFSHNLSQFFPVLAVANTGSCVGLQNKTGHPAGYRFPC